jgi:hypothetical protein
MADIDDWSHTDNEQSFVSTVMYPNLNHMLLNTLPFVTEENVMLSTDCR